MKEDKENLLMHENHVIIMAGGIGSRFWPISTPEYPKQFIDILGCGKTLIQLTFDRFRSICKEENFWVVTNSSYVEIVKKQLPFVPTMHILSEPKARNTAPCIAWACWMLHQENPNANVVVTPADSVVMDTNVFKSVIINLLDFTKKNPVIATVGIKPSRPEIGYGYIELAEEVETDICHVNAFKEKPDLATARDYVQSGKYLWNSGLFVWKVNTIIRAIKKYKPDLATIMNEIVSGGDVDFLFPKCEKISIDYAIIEPAAKDGQVFTHFADFGWSDLGNWTSLYEKLQKDSANNCAVGPVQFYDCTNCLVHTENANKVVIQGLEGCIIAERNGQILVCQKKR